MPQDRASGNAGRQFGSECGDRLPAMISAKRLSSRSNEVVWNGRSAVVKCARIKSTANPTIGVLSDMLERIDVVIGAFQRSGQEFDIYWMTAAEYIQHSRLKPADEKRTKDQRMMNRSTFVANGRKLQTVLFDPPLTSVQ